MQRGKKCQQSLWQMQKKTWHMHKIKIGDRTVLTAAASVMNW